MTHGSQQLRQFRIAIRDGASVEAAAASVGMSIGEARLHARADQSSPPPEEAYQLLRLNEGPKMPDTAADELRLLIERAERLLDEKRGISDDIRDVFAEAKGRGYDPAAMREVIRLRLQDREKREAHAAMVQLYGEQLDLF